MQLIMKVGNYHVTGTFFLPALIGVCAVSLGFWISKRNDAKNGTKNEGSELQEDKQPVEEATKKKKSKRKGHSCNCGSEKSNTLDELPEQIKILYGSVTGKSKVTTSCSQTCKITTYLVLNALHVLIFQKFAETLGEHITSNNISASLVNLKDCDPEGDLFESVSSLFS